jgi:hypothetical protein
MDSMVCGITPGWRMVGALILGFYVLGPRIGHTMRDERSKLQVLVEWS